MGDISDDMIEASMRFPGMSEVDAYARYLDELVDEAHASAVKANVPSLMIVGNVKQEGLHGNVTVGALGEIAAKVLKLSPRQTKALMTWYRFADWGDSIDVIARNNAIRLILVPPEASMQDLNNQTGIVSFPGPFIRSHSRRAPVVSRFAAGYPKHDG